MELEHYSIMGDLRNNIYSKISGNRQGKPTTMLPCLIMDINNKLQASVYIPMIASKIHNIPFINNSHSDVVTPEIGSLAIFVQTSDGKRAVFGNTFVNNEDTSSLNLFKEETLRANKKTSFKQDIQGNAVLSNSNAAMEFIGNNNTKVSTSNQSTKITHNTTTLEGSVTINKISYPYKRIMYYTKEERDKKGEISTRVEEAIKFSEDFINDVNNYAMGIDEVEDIPTFKKELIEKYSFKRKLVMIEEYGIVTDKEIYTTECMNKLTENDIIKVDNKPMMYRMKIID